MSTLSPQIKEDFEKYLSIWLKILKDQPDLRKEIQRYRENSKSSRENHSTKIDIFNGNIDDNRVL